MNRRAITLTLAFAAVAVEGCGGGSSTHSTAATTAQALSKAAYEQRLGPLLNQQIDPALRTALANGGAKDPGKLAAVISTLQTARNQMAVVIPPAAVADLHTQAVATLATLTVDVQRLRDAELAAQKSAAVSALETIKTDALRLLKIGDQFTARGY